MAALLRLRLTIKSDVNSIKNPPYFDGLSLFLGIIPDVEVRDNSCVTDPLLPTCSGMTVKQLVCKPERRRDLATESQSLMMNVSRQLLASELGGNQS